ncbi:efflux RND transporter periplasmic adaptor subunit [uncultured Ferrimonas sp.]|uniref:efflux RND transporter periplasmic adaptor subunit n=1 Tax=uncultured Ferrimonas sp. TaxID=432640 RepID=UPI00262F8AD8|nr:efflux RND transporter periplasmic adaptor subunit [uncultured Ferrimonas sp.]
MRLLFIGAALCLLTACQQPPEATTAVVRPIAWAQISASPLEQSRTLSGVLLPVERAELSFEVSGKIAAVSANLGSKVKQGDSLARLDKRNFELAIQSAAAEVEKAQATFAEAQSEYVRRQKMIAKKLISPSEFDSAKAVFAAAKSSVDVALARLDIAHKDLQDSVLSAPYDGTITKRFIEPSQQINAGSVAFEIEGTHGFEVQIMVPETLIRELQQDALMHVSITGLQRQLQGRITEIGTRAGSANAFPVTIVLQGEQQRLRAGMTAEVEFVYLGKGRTGHSGNTVIIPISALLAQLDQQVSVFVYDPKQQVVRQRVVQTENIIDNQVFISQGLAEGEIIATAGVAFLRDGQAVTLLEQRIQLFN